MSTFKAVAAITETLKRRLEQGIRDHIPDAVVTTQRPETEPAGIDKKTPRINLYLFQAANNPSFRNADLPTRNGDGAFVQRPQVALDLNYLMSFFGDDHLKGQLLLGLTSSSLHTEPYLGASEIHLATQGTPFQSSFNQDVGVRIAPLTLTLEEMTKFWSGFFQVPYTLSLAYQASVVLLDAGGTPQALLPVSQVKVSASPERWPIPAANALSSVPPRIEGDVRFDPETRKITITVSPAVDPGQTIQLLLNDIEHGQPSYSYSQVNEEEQPAQVSFPVPDVAPGSYLVQVVVAGAASRLEPSLGRYRYPSVRVPPLL